MVSRNTAVAAQLKASGVKSGVPDCSYPCPSLGALRGSGGRQNYEPALGFYGNLCPAVAWAGTGVCLRATAKMALRFGVAQGPRGLRD